MKTNKIILSLLLALFFPLASWAHNRLIINQVMYDTPLTEVASDKGAYNGEFIELYNAGAEDIELDEWGIISLSGKKQKEASQFDNVTIPSGGYYVFAIRRGDGNTFELKDLYTSIQSQIPVIEYQDKIILANAKETLYLLHNNDTIDQIVCGSETQLKAKNASNISGNDCVSLHRTAVEFDADGKAIPAKSQWKTDKVTFSQCQLPKRIYEDRTIISFKPSSMGVASTVNGNNYILSITPLDETDKINVTKDGISVDGNVRTNTVIQYYDGLGRPNEQIAVGAAPYKNDLVSTTTYDGLHRATKQWLPIPMASEGQFTDIATVQQQAQKVLDNRPFTETLYENSALDRVIGQKRPGESYEDHPSTSKFEVAAERDIRIYTVIEGSLKPRDCYPAYTLFKTTTKDEDGKGSVSVFTDKLGRKIMEERSGSRTYFVYDDLGRLCFVLPNLPKNKFTSGEYDKERIPLRQTAYCYDYDARGNMIYKRLPGCEPIYMVYDVMGQLVLKQDGNQRVKNKWLLYSYDELGRSTYTAEITMQTDWRALVDKFANEWQVEDKALSVLGIDKSGLRMLTENYYDNYDYIPSILLGEDLRYKNKSDFGEMYDNAKGLLTGTLAYNLSEPGYEATSYYYDAKGRVVQSHSMHHYENKDGIVCLNGGIDTYTKYNFDETVAKQYTYTENAAIGLTCELYSYTYDHAGRPKEVRYKRDDRDEVLLSAFSYDRMGNLAQNLLHNSSDTIRYSYDTRNMLTEAQNRHFSEKLYYADIPSGALPNPNVTKCYNGNISAMSVGNEDDGFTSFLNTYDEQNRLTASFTHAGAMGTGEHYSYDDAGNIMSLKRHTYGHLYDDLSFYYGNEGNQLLSVTNEGESADMYNIVEFPKSAPESDMPMSYDANGNLIRDAYRDISIIKYNILNLPDTIQFKTGHQIVNHYNAFGKKYKTIDYINTIQGEASYNDVVHYSLESYKGLNVAPFDYCITDYKGGVIAKTEKYSDKTTCSRTVYNATGFSRGSTYYHYIKNHLGSICAVVSDKGDVVQSTMYLASGVPAEESFGRNVQPFLYNGKEYITAHELNEYDSQARRYYATIMRATTIDPLAEKYYHISPYAWCNNDPVNRFDPDGRHNYRHDRKTGDFVLQEETKDDFDQIGKYKYNKKTGEYEPKKDNDGNLKIYTDHRGNNGKIAKGILYDGLNIKQDGYNFLADDNAGPTVNDYFNFALILDEVAGVEISGYVKSVEGKSSKVVKFEPYKDNTFCTNYTHRINLSNSTSLIHFHTHGHADTESYAKTPSDKYDIPNKNKIAGWYPGIHIQFLILHNYGAPIEY